LRTLCLASERSRAISLAQVRAPRATSPFSCGSGKKYKHCWCDKRFDYEEDDDGTIFKSIPLLARSGAGLSAG
jgi:hypothetical protein